VYLLCNSLVRIAVKNTIYSVIFEPVSSNLHLLSRSVRPRNRGDCELEWANPNRKYNLKSQNNATFVLYDSGNASNRFYRSKWHVILTTISATGVKIAHLVASLPTNRQQVVFALLVSSCQKVWNKLLTTCNNLVDISRLVTRLFQQVRYSYDITVLL
jgi:hypothetical protein